MIARSLDDRLDMVVGSRIDREQAAYRPGHRTGNRLLTAFVAQVFGRAFNDMLSGYRVFSRRFVKSFPVLSGGFEIETELTVHALELELAGRRDRRRPITRGRKARPRSSTPGATASASCAPSSSFTAPSGRCRSSARIGIALAIISVGFAIPIFVTYMQEGLVPRLPTAVLSTGLMMLAFLSLAFGLVLDTVTRGRREMKLLAYLAQRAPGEERRRS